MQNAVCAAIKDVFQDTRSILEPAGASFAVELLDEQCRENKVIAAKGEKTTAQGHGTGVLKRLTAALPPGTKRFHMRITIQ